MKFFAAFVFLIGAASSKAQTPIVPDQIEFGGITLSIREDAKKEIQKDVNMLTQHAGYFAVKTTRAKMYFPIIEKILEEDGVPTDFKFLALQESSLVPDAVSSSNAVGFWQFKDFTAMEMGMRVDERVDERMNIIAATKGAAKYLNKNNVQFSNWIHTLQSYQMGAGGVKRALPELKMGATEMEVTSATYWYVKRFLAHKVAFENSLAGESEMKLIPFTTASQKTLKDISKELSVDEPILKEYNKWLKAETIPEDKAYTVIIPVGKLHTGFNNLWLTSTQKKSLPTLHVQAESRHDSLFQVNGILAIYAQKKEDAVKLAVRGKVELSDFLKFNEIDISTPIKEGAIFLLGKKKNTTFSAYHQAKKGENLWSISQAYGIKLKRVKKFNPQIFDNELPSGTIVWLSSKKSPIAETTENVVELNNSETFDWIPANPVSTAKESVDSVVIKVTEAPQAPKLDSVSSPKFIEIPPQNSSESKTHTVLPKETLYSIANQYNLKVVELVKLNSLDINGTLKPGQVLVLSGSPSTNAAEALTKTPTETIHEVKTSDTLYSIARQYGVTIRDIMEWNNKKDFTLSQGEILQIKKR